MSADTPSSNRPGPNRPSDERIDRNWQELLQELRVAQTGVQILTGFLLTIPFTPGFEALPDSRRVTYTAVLCGAVVSTLMLMTPVALHRALFRRGARLWLVETADRFARWGLGTMALTIVGVVWFILDVVWSLWPATVIAVPILLFVIVFWVVIPARERRVGRRAALSPSRGTRRRD